MNNPEALCASWTDGTELMIGDKFCITKPIFVKRKQKRFNKKSSQRIIIKKYYTVTARSIFESM